MADIFLSYTRGDAAIAARLAAELEQRGFSVFWDTEVLPGQQWRDVIHDELVRSACVIVVWSEGSTRSRWVVEEASEALEAGKLLPVMLDDSLPPFGFRGVEAANLGAWTPGTPNVEFNNLVDAVGRILADAAPDAVAAETPPAPAPDAAPAEPKESPPSPPPVDDQADVAAEDRSDAAIAAQDEPGSAAVRDEPGSAAVRDESGSAAVRDESGSAAVRDELPPIPPTVPAPPVSELKAPGSTDGPTDRSGTAAGLEGIAARLGTAGKLGIGAAVVLVIIIGMVMASGGDDEPPSTTIAGGASTTAGQVTSTADGVITQIVESDAVTAFRAGSAPVIDGDLGDWGGVPEASRLQTEVFRDADVTERLGEDSPGVVTALYDDTALYLAVVSDDDVYSQQNTGNQIWRGDALDINLTIASPGGISERPDGDDFQLTMTPRAADGRPSIVWFIGNGSGFADNTTDLPVTLAGEVNDDGSWQLEAAIPWTVFGLTGPPAGDLAALVAVFDNDGEIVDGQPQQTVILGHTSAEFQRPLTWGTLRLER